MMREKILRITLSISFLFNIISAYVIFMPDGFLGQFIGLPKSVPIAYKVFLSFLIAYFGLVYLWMSFQTQIDRPLVKVAAGAKTLTFFLFLGLWLFGHVTGLAALMAVGDLVFGAIWIGCLMGVTSNSGSPSKSFQGPF